MQGERNKARCKTGLFRYGSGADTSKNMTGQLMGGKRQLSERSLSARCKSHLADSNLESRSPPHMETCNEMTEAGSSSTKRKWTDG